jgi:hypothetical protein
LRRAGFAVYMRQDVWVLAQAENSRSEMASLELTPYQKKDDWEVQLLYANTVPRLVQMVDPMPPTSEGEGWVLREAGELSAFVHLHQGDTATWLRLFIHPNAEAQADEIVASLLHLKEESVICPFTAACPATKAGCRGPGAHRLPLLGQPGGDGETYRTAFTKVDGENGRFRNRRYSR